MTIPSADRQESNPVPAADPSYERPILRALGDVRDLTLGGSLGTGDSGSPRVQRR
jgi:hypothetical protein